MKYQELLKQAEEALEKGGIAEYKLDAWYLFEAATGMSRGQFFMKCRDEITDEALEGKLSEMLEKRLQRIPLQQILGSQEFMGLTFAVNEHVLIPRQDTETLVEEAIRLGKDYLKSGPVRILDLCTGSGCIGISTVRFLPGVTAVLSDISEEALQVAKQNIGVNEVDSICSVVLSDLFENLKGEVFTMILSNPPYIPSRVVDTLEPEVKDHEPRLALDGMEDGLYYYRRIAAEAGEHLVGGGRILFEIGHDQGEAVSALLRAAGFMEVRTIRDLCGNDRVVTGVRV